MNDTNDAKQSTDAGSQADELTEMWDASSLDAATAEFEAQAASQPATAPQRRDEPSIQVNTAAISAPPAARRPKKKGGLNVVMSSLPVQLALAAVVAVTTFWVVKQLLAH